MKTPKLGKSLGRKIDAHDKRDYRVNALPHLGVGAPLPTRIDVFAGLNLPVYDQERKLRWNDAVNDDSGAAIRDIFYVLAHTGVCPEDLDPYNPAYFASAAFNDNPKDLEGAQPFRIGAYHRVPDALTARSVLASGYAIALGFTVYESFEDIGADGLMRMPRKGEAVLGGHAVVIRGYDDENSEFLIQNSWGVGWGNHGCFRMPYRFLEDEDLSQFDMWIGHLGRPWRPN